MNKISRRDFISSLPRWAIGGALAGGAVWLMSRSKGKKQTCTSKIAYCKKCPDKKACGLPAAMSYRKVSTRRSGNA